MHHVNAEPIAAGHPQQASSGPTTQQLNSTKQTNTFHVQTAADDLYFDELRETYRLPHSRSLFDNTILSVKIENFGAKTTNVESANVNMGSNNSTQTADNSNMAYNAIRLGLQFKGSLITSSISNPINFSGNENILYCRIRFVNAQPLQELALPCSFTIVVLERSDSNKILGLSAQLTLLKHNGNAYNSAVNNSNYQGVEAAVHPHTSPTYYDMIPEGS